jgi:isopentenyldiphosphate isomerase
MATVRGVATTIADRSADRDEVLDLVDEHDCVIGTVKKSQAHGDPSLRHREVAVIVHCGRSILWQQRAWSKSVLPGVWDITCAGHVSAGEAPDAAAVRELREELGFELELAFVERRTVARPNETYIAHVFHGVAGVDLCPRPHHDEVAAVQWGGPEELARWRASGRVVSEVACALAESLWSSPACVVPCPPSARRRLVAPITADRLRRRGRA